MRVLELFEELNYPSATKMRATLIKRGHTTQSKDVEAFVKSQTPTHLFAKAPRYRGKTIATRPNERWVMDFIDFKAEPSNEYKDIFLVQDIFSRQIWATALEEKLTGNNITILRSLFAEHGKPNQVNADGEFDNTRMNKCWHAQLLQRDTQRVGNVWPRLLPPCITFKR